jgi:hypothetical protein
VLRVGKNLAIRHSHLCTVPHACAAPLRIVGDLIETMGLQGAHDSQRAALCSILDMNF